MMGSGGMADMDMEEVVDGVLEMFAEFIQQLLGASDEDLEQLKAMVEEMMAGADGFESISEMLGGEAEFLGALMGNDEAVQALCGVVDMLSDMDSESMEGGAEEVVEVRRRALGIRGGAGAAVMGVVRGFEAVQRHRGPPGPPGHRPAPPSAASGSDEDAEGFLEGVQGLVEQLGEAVQAFVGRCEAMTSAELESVEAGIEEFIEGAAEAVGEALEASSSEVEAAVESAEEASSSEVEAAAA